MKYKISIAAVLLGVVALLVSSPRGSGQEKSHVATTVSLRKLADSLHAVIAADREAYSRVVIERLALQERKLEVSERWREEMALPTHAQMLRSTAEQIQKRGAEFSYVLRSLWPIDPNHGPQTEVEVQGLEFVRRNPGTNFYSDEVLGGRSYFTAAYADRATLTSCIDCHNQHPSSPRRDFRQDDVMGALIIRIPLEF